MAPPEDPKAASADEAPRFSQQLASPTVKILVGSPPKQFSVHFDVLCRKSPRFETMFKEGYPIGHKQVLELQYAIVSVFELFMTWLYQDIIEKPAGSETAVIELLRDLVIFAERYSISDLADLAMDSMIKARKEIGKFPGCVNLRMYTTTKPGSRLRKLYIKTLAHITFDRRKNTDCTDQILISVLQRHADIFPGYIKELRMRYEMPGVQHPFKLAPCTYHGHGNNQPCPVASKKRKRDVDDE